MIFLSTDKASQEAKNHPLGTLARKSRSSHSTEKQSDPDKVTVRAQGDSSLPDAQWHRSKTARFSQY